MLENKLNLYDSAALAREEERISKKKAAELFENHILDNLEAALTNIDKMPQKTFDEIIEKICRNEHCTSVSRRKWPQHPYLAGSYFKTEEL